MTLDEIQFNAARFAFGCAVAFCTEPTDGGLSRTSGGDASAFTSALTGATFISLRRARTSAVNPG
jgi:hypothetical protein